MRTEVLHKAKEEKDILNGMKKRKNNWICHVLRTKCLLKRVSGKKIKERI